MIVTTSPASNVSASAAAELACIVCGKSTAQVFFELNDIPVLCNTPCATREEALSFPKGLITLAFCHNCGHVFNSSFTPELMLYNQQYENSLHYSPVFDNYINELGRDLVNRFQLQNKDIIEIGCGKGDFLSLLCRLGNNRGIGFDPSYEPDRFDGSRAHGINIVRDLYTESHGDLACDFLCCRQTLEHIADPVSFLHNIRRSLGDKHAGTPIFFEVPNALYTLQHRGIWDIIYEHVSYFWSVPLAHLFHEAGFSVTRINEAFGGQYVCVEAIQGPPQNDSQSQVALAQVAEDIRVFGDTFRSMMERATLILEEIQRQGKRAVVWGAGSKGVTFLNLFKRFDLLEYAVDINPHKQGKHVPGAGCEIVPPEALRKYQPDVVFLMNPLYRDEIGRQLCDLSPLSKIVPI